MNSNTEPYPRKNDGEPCQLLVLMMTTRCNLSCRYCYASACTDGMDMDISVARRAMELFMPSDGRLTVQFSGGEPLLVYDRLKEIIRTCRYSRIRFAAQTNGLLVDREKLLFFADNGVGLGLSMDGVPGVNEALRGGTRQVLRALNALDDLGIGVNMTSVLTRPSVERFAEFLLFCARHRCIDTINLDLLRFVGKASQIDLAPDCEQIEEMVHIMASTLAFVNARRRSRLKVRELEQFYDRNATRRDAPYCLAGQGASLTVTPEGDVYPCPSLVGVQKYYAGNILDKKRPCLDHQLADWGLPSACHACPARFFCRGGCPARRIAATGTPKNKYEVDCALRWAIYQQMSSNLARRRIGR